MFRPSRMSRFTCHMLIGKLPYCTVKDTNRRIIALIKHSGLPFLTVASLVRVTQARVEP